MLAHVTDSGVIYEVEISQEEVEQRMSALIGKLYPTFLELRAPSRGAEVVGSYTHHLKTEYAPEDPQPRTRVHVDPREAVTVCG